MNVGKILGINVELHWSFFLIYAAMILLAITGGLYNVLFVAACVTGTYTVVYLHEMGHYLLGKRYNLAFKKLSLMWIGGFLHLDSRDKLSPKQNFLFHFAGPAVNIISLCLLQLIIDDTSYQYKNTLDGTLNIVIPNLNNFLLLLKNVNLVMLLNLLPISILDGGRMLESALQLGKVKLRHEILLIVSVSICVVFLSYQLLFASITLYFPIAVWLLIVSCVYYLRQR